MIRSLDHKDKGEWKKLYNAYADFYKIPMNSGILDTLWDWIHDDNHRESSPIKYLKYLNSLEGYKNRHKHYIIFSIFPYLYGPKILSYLLNNQSNPLKLLRNN